MGILDKLTVETIKIPLKSTTKEEVLHELVNVLKDAGLAKDADEAYSAVASRESQGSTGLGEEVAIPHAKTMAVKDIAIVVGISHKGISFNSLDGKPVKMFFLILANPDHASAHIEALSEIAKATRNKAFCRMLLSSETAEDVLQVFKAD